MSETYEVVLMFGKDKHWAEVCVQQLKDKMGLKAEVRRVLKKDDPSKLSNQKE